MSTRRRIFRTSITVLTVLALGSITSACFLGASDIGPKRAFAEAPLVNTGVLGVGDRTIAPIAGSLTATDKVAPASVSNSAAASQAAPSAKLIAASIKHVAKPTRVVIGRKAAAKTAAKISTKGPWRKARVSWYGPGFYGHTMAGGGRLGHNSMIVANKHLPFGTRILFMSRGRTVIATVRDRGPYVSGRQFDLGPGTAKALHFQGVGTVRYRILGRARRT